MLLSIHTPTWGVTDGCITDNQGSLVSIHTPTWGVTTIIALSLPPERTGYPVLENKQEEKNIGLPGSSYFCCLKEEVNHP